ncbi:sigma-70 family RNA polymerase sigma factor [Pantoea sp. Tr-811]|uniref:sigma-70 family RNA polymerase sigma factor n=1 Tax=unclassified Pantoea TaxID=2630326 RepID=UPI0014210E46|nr:MULTISPECIES: sigma-70 family RNA polymerase sigma factor [unclassified Pantoea]NIE73371.1 sigma-70 family RNA polymerase sigma factor [Pantoea sp. Ap-967]NIF27634.1 sigma-70 family RNA polymerase sigma factor [Pantoea sp. Tr-811]
MDVQNLPKQQTVTRIFQQHYAWLRARLAFRTGCNHSAEDLAAETFLRVWMLPDPTAIREPRALLTTIAQRLMYETWRRRDLEKAYLQALALVPEDLQPSPHEQLMLVESLVAIDRLLDGLSSQARTVFVLSQLEGLTYVQIQERLGLSLGRIHQLMAQALRCCYQGLET